MKNLTLFHRRTALASALLLGGSAAAFALQNFDQDADGVPDDRDRCLYSAQGAAVDAQGCALPADQDQDGVPDRADACPLSPLGSEVDRQGCALDSDLDGIANGIDQCAATPAGSFVDERGCVLGAPAQAVADASSGRGSGSSVPESVIAEPASVVSMARPVVEAAPEKAAPKAEPDLFFVSPVRPGAGVRVEHTSALVPVPPISDREPAQEIADVYPVVGDPIVSVSAAAVDAGPLRNAQATVSADETTVARAVPPEQAALPLAQVYAPREVPGMAVASVPGGGRFEDRALSTSAGIRSSAPAATIEARSSRRRVRDSEPLDVDAAEAPRAAVPNIAAKNPSVSPRAPRRPIAPVPVVRPAPEAKFAVARGMEPRPPLPGRRYLTLYFEPQKSTLTPDSQTILAHQPAMLLAQLYRSPRASLVVVGHADPRVDGDRASLASGRRAEAVRQQLVSLGLSPERITVRSSGVAEPRFSGSEQALNCRAELYLYEPEPVGQSVDGGRAYSVSASRAVPDAMTTVAFQPYSTMLDEAGTRSLERFVASLAPALPRDGSVQLRITGSSDQDEVAMPSSTLALGRAAAVRRYLISRGMRESQVEVAPLPYGLPPVADGRRAEIRVLTAVGS